MDPKWFIGSNDGKNFIASQDPDDLPVDATPAPIHQQPTQNQIDALYRGGAESVQINHTPTGKAVD